MSMATTLSGRSHDGSSLWYAAACGSATPFKRRSKPILRTYLVVSMLYNRDEKHIKLAFYVRFEIECTKRRLYDILPIVVIIVIYFALISAKIHTMVSIVGVSLAYLGCFLLSFFKQKTFNVMHCLWVIAKILILIQYKRKRIIMTAATAAKAWKKKEKHMLTCYWLVTL